MSGHGEMVKAGKVPLTVIGSWDDGLGWYPQAGSLDDWQRTQARRCCARQVHEGRMPAEDLPAVLAALGLT